MKTLLSSGGTGFRPVLFFSSFFFPLLLTAATSSTGK